MDASLIYFSSPAFDHTLLCRVPTTSLLIWAIS
jgi:hypothetical protein